jgi:hypothetical protein
LLVSLSAPMTEERDDLLQPCAVGLAGSIQANEQHILAVREPVQVRELAVGAPSGKMPCATIWPPICTSLRWAVPARCSAGTYTCMRAGMGNTGTAVRTPAAALTFVFTWCTTTLHSPLNY